MKQWNVHSLPLYNCNVQFFSEPTKNLTFFNISKQSTKKDAPTLIGQYVHTHNELLSFPVMEYS